MGILKSILKIGEGVSARVGRRSQLSERIHLERARARIVHRRPYDFDAKRGIFLMKRVDDDEVIEGLPVEVIDGQRFGVLSSQESLNVKTKVGIVFLHTQGYSASPGGSGLRFIALSNDSLTEDSDSTTLSNEIAANGLSRAAGTVTLPTGAGTVTTVDKTFTATGSQSAQKAALFTASSSGTMNHALSFTQRSLITNDTLQVTFSITLS